TRSDRDWSSDVCSSDLFRQADDDSQSDHRIVLYQQYRRSPHVCSRNGQVRRTTPGSTRREIHFLKPFDLIKAFVMQEREHTSKQYEQQLRSLKEKLLLIGYKAETSIADAAQALVERRPSLAERVVDEDDEVDRLELEIDDICFEILAREQPVASDLRFITTAMKIVG